MHLLVAGFEGVTDGGNAVGIGGLAAGAVEGAYDEVLGGADGVGEGEYGGCCYDV